MIYTPVLNRGGRGVRSPLDRLRQAVGQESRALSRPVERDNAGG